MYKLGIIGFGVVGKSMLSFLKKYHVDGAPPSDQELFDDEFIRRSIQVNVWDKRMYTPDEQALLAAYGAQGFSADQLSLDDFVNQQDFVVPSPGIDLQTLSKFQEKLLSELDFFSVFFRKSTIGVTGSLGKTTTTRLLAKVLSSARMLDVQDRPNATTTHYLARQFPVNENIRVICAGNIGKGMLDLVDDAENIDLSVLELSSFQLELNNKYAPDIALWTNFYPNHLDRHKTMEAYFKAKWNILIHQKEHQVALFTRDLVVGPGQDYLRQNLPTLKSAVIITDHQDFDRELVKLVPLDTYQYAYIHDSMLFLSDIVAGAVKSTYGICRVDRLPELTFLSNWIQVLVAAYITGADMHYLEDVIASGAIALDDNLYRLNKFATVDGVDFYDDSKSTIAQATLAAVSRLSLSSRPIILILGGLGKGVDRSFLMDELSKNKAIKKVYCFGPECWLFSGADVRQSLDDIVKDISSQMKPGDQVLFSPSGASFDAFKNYEHRGEVFESLVKSLLVHQAP